MGENNKAVQNKNLSLSGPDQGMSEAMPWLVFLTLIGFGLYSLMYFPAQVGYGLVATAIFRGDITTNARTFVQILEYIRRR